MKKVIAILFLIVGRNSFADCIVSQHLESLYKVECQNYLGQTTLFNNIGKEFAVLKSEKQTVYIDTGSDVLDIGSNVYLNAPVAEVKQNPPIAVEVELPTKSIISNPLEADNYRITARAFSYSHQSVNADFGFSDTTIETSQNEVRTLPQQFNFEFLFNESGMILTPDFEQDSGEIVAYMKFGVFSLGLYSKIAIDSNNSTLTKSGVKLQDDDTSSTELQVGLYARLEQEVGDGWYFYGEGRNGFYREVTKAYNNLNDALSEISVNAAYIEIRPSLYHQVSEKFRFGFGAELAFALGMMQVEDNSGVVSDGVRLVNLAVYPLQMQFTF